jgi:hypothetical protein
MTGTRDYEWILCLPILTSPDGTAIGVFEFAGTRDHNTETTNQLAAFAQQIAQRDPAIDTDTFDRFWYVPMPASGMAWPTSRARRGSTTA